MPSDDAKGKLAKDTVVQLGNDVLSHLHLAFSPFLLLRFFCCRCRCFCCCSHTE